MKFKKGDRVRCIDNYGYEKTLNKKSTYTISRYVDTVNKLLSLDDLSLTACEYRFELVVGLTIQDAINSGKEFKRQGWDTDYYTKILDDGYTIALSRKRDNGIRTLSTKDILATDYILRENATLKVDGLQHTLELQSDGSLKAGCNHVSSENVDKIIEYLTEERKRVK